MEDNTKPTGNPSDHLANERTFLAWIRTSVAIMGFGFVVVKFSLFIKQISVVLANKQVVLPGKGYSSEIGTLLVGLGVFIVLFSYLRYRITEKQLTNRAYKPSLLPSLFITIALVIIGVLLVIYLIPGL
ncbi:MAG: YidH family protein [Mucilaginibacter sp.]